MTTLTNLFEEFLKEPRKALESLLPQTEQIKKIFSFDYDDKPSDEKYYGMHRHWLKLLHDYYFAVEHVGHVPEIEEIAKKENVILISNHANTLEAALICYFFYAREMGVVRSLVFKEAFRLPLVREFFKSGQCVPVSVSAGKAALKNDHILLFPEGMEFIKHYLKKDYVVRFHKGFLRIARDYLRETGKKHVTIIPVGHDGIDDTIKFWVINNPFLVKNFIKPFLHYPYFVLPKTPFVFPTKAIFNWGPPRRVEAHELKDEKTMAHLAYDFRHEIMRLKTRARKVRRMAKGEDVYLPE